MQLIHGNDHFIKTSNESALLPGTGGADGHLVEKRAKKREIDQASKESIAQMNSRRIIDLSSIGCHRGLRLCHVDGGGDNGERRVRNCELGELRIDIVISNLQESLVRGESTVLVFPSLFGRNSPPLLNLCFHCFA